MQDRRVTKATLGRLPVYKHYLESVCEDKKNISATVIARQLNLGEVQVRKDLGAVSGEGKPKIGYNTQELIDSIEACLGQNRKSKAVIVGAGKLGRALLDYDGFADYGLEIAAAFDNATDKIYLSELGKPVYPIKEFESFCYTEDIKIGIITVPKENAQQVCDLMIKNNIAVIWSFAAVALYAPDNVILKQENLALSLAHLTKRA